MTELYYKVADLVFKLWTAESADMEALLPNCRPFKVEGGEPVAVFELRTVMAQYDDKVLLEADDSDMGHTEVFGIDGGTRYLVEISEEGRVFGSMAADKDFSDMLLCYNPSSHWASDVVSSMLRVAFAQCVLAHGGISMHSSTVICGDRAYMFMGKSGTGKSTHTRLWRENIPGTRLLNDDNPYVRIMDGSTIVYGSPWSGKTPCYRNLSAQLGGVVRLYQAPYNRIRLASGIEALSQILPGCSALRRDPVLNNRLVDNVLALMETSPIAALECLPDAAAAHTSHDFLTNLLHENQS